MRTLFLLFLYKLYKYKINLLRQQILNLVKIFDNGEFNSTYLRKIFYDYYKVNVGLYSHGGCFSPNSFQPFTTIGRYCSIARSAKAYNRDHPVNHKSTSALFFNPKLGYSKEEIIEYTPLYIGNDVWIGHNVTILPNVKVIHDGAIISSGSVLNKNAPPYGIMVGHPARLVRYRFSIETIDSLIEEKWWDRPINSLVETLKEFQIPLS